MKFGIEIRNIHTGAAHVLDDLQAVANFLADKAHDEWEGFRHLGALPAPTVDTPAVSVEGAEALVDQSAAQVSDSALAAGASLGTATMVFTADAVYSDDVAGAKPISELPPGITLVDGTGVAEASSSSEPL